MIDVVSIEKKKSKKAETAGRSMSSRGVITIKNEKKTSVVRSRISSKLIFASCVGYLYECTLPSRTKNLLLVVPIVYSCRDAHYNMKTVLTSITNAILPTNKKNSHFCTFEQSAYDTAGNPSPPTPWINTLFSRWSSMSTGLARQEAG